MKVPVKDQKLELLRAIPSVESLLVRPSIVKLTERMDRVVLRNALRTVLDRLRADIMAGSSLAGEDGLMAEIQDRIGRAVSSTERPSLCPVINATGVVIHTNLGRAPLAEGAIRAIRDIGQGYSNLEYQLATGRRGRREVHCETLLKELLSCPAALVVNNNAAAVLLVLNTLAEAGEVIVSRGELVEIGGSFRVPEIMAKSRAVLREVGATNRTRIGDYERAINDRTRLLLRVHQSNFRIAGFTEQPTLEDLVGLGRRYGIPCYQDLGSGSLVRMHSWGIENEPLVQESVKRGVDICSFSGDKLLGGPQAGIIVGEKSLVDQLRGNPLMRVVRPDKLTYAALEATLRLYCQGLGQTEIPVLRMLSQPVDQIRRRARLFIRRARRFSPDDVIFRLEPGVSVAGGGAAPESEIETVLIRLESSRYTAEQVQRQLRAFKPPIISRIEGDGVVFDFRTVKSDEEKILLSALQHIFSPAKTLQGVS